MNKKYCPLTDSEYPCNGTCPWYMGGDCAVVVIAGSLRILANDTRIGEAVRKLEEQKYYHAAEIVKQTVKHATEN